jgi:hypothetical protein
MWQHPNNAGPLPFQKWAFIFSGHHRIAPDQSFRILTNQSHPGISLMDEALSSDFSAWHGQNAQSWAASDGGNAPWQLERKEGLWLFPQKFDGSGAGRLSKNSAAGFAMVGTTHSQRGVAVPASTII